MPNSFPVPAAGRTRSATRKRLTQVARTAIVIVSLLVASTRTAAAQVTAAQARSWEFRITSGAFVPVGAQRDFLKDAQLTAAQVTWVVRPALAITGTFGWARSRDLTLEGTPKLDVFDADLGVEYRPSEWFSDRAVTFSRFAGLGAGMRSYNYRSLDVDATHTVAGYAAVGGEFGIGRVGLRLELRDYASGFKPLIGIGKHDTRNDLIIMAGLRFNRHHAPPK